MTSDTDARLTELEIKASFADDLLEQLNTVIVRQQQQIDALQRELLGLRQQIRDSERPGSLISAGDERPPHY
jgi:SlyX protein